MKIARFITARMLNTATPLILGPGRTGRVITGYYPRTSDGKQKAKVRDGKTCVRC